MEKETPNTKIAGGEPKPSAEPDTSQRKSPGPKRNVDSSAKNEGTYQSLFEDAPLPYQSLNAEGIILRVNSSWLEMFGYDRNEVIGKWIGDFLTEASLETLKEIFPRFIESGEVHNVRFELKRKDGGNVFAEVNGKIHYGSAGEMKYTHCILTNITSKLEMETKLRDSEAMFRKLAERTSMGIAEISPDMRILALNEQMKKWYPGIDPGTGAFCYKAFNDPPRNEICSYCPTIKVFQDGKVHESITDTLAGREIINFRITATPVFGENGDVISVIEFVEDVTDRLKLQKIIERMEKLDALGMLASGVAHDFNNILLGIIGNASLAGKHAGNNPHLSRFLKEIDKSAVRAKNLALQLLTFARGGDPVRKVISIGNIVREAAEIGLHGSNVRCEFEIQEDLLNVNVDEDQIVQVISNLVINADQAMERGGAIRIEVSNAVVDDRSFLGLNPGEYVRISVIDQGPGISEKELKKIFDPFYTTKKKGSGLGLSSAYSIVKRHGGIIDVESRKGEGSTFAILLPATREKIAGSGIENMEIFTGKGRILIVDDEKVVREFFITCLEELGYSPEAAADGSEGFEMYKKALGTKMPFDAVILDLTVRGGKGGKEIIDELTQIDPEIRAVVSSGYSNDPVLSFYKEYGFAGRLAKPFRINELSRVLHDVLGD